MDAAQKNFIIEDGIAWGFSFVWKTGTESSRTPVNITGFSASLKIFRKSDGELLATYTPSSGEITVGTTDGKYSVNISAAKITDLNFVTADYEFDIINTTPEPIRRIKGEITKNPKK